MQYPNTVKAVRGSLLDISEVGSDLESIENNLRYIKDGLLIINQGKVAFAGEWKEGKDSLPDSIRICDYRGKLIVPGFIDTHIHYPQMEIVGAYGEQLLEWLNTYTFPTEMKYGDKRYAKEMAGLFVKELLKNGTTTAMVFCSVHPESVDALFEVCDQRNMRMIAGKVMMDRNAPEELLDTPQSSYDDSRRLLKKWHNRNRLLYAITPRFAPTSSPEQLEKAMALREEFPDAYVQTHLSENTDEIAWVESLFPERKSYLDVYDHYRLTGERSVYAHCIHLDEQEWQTMAETGSSVAFCPTSNMYLGSGLFNYPKAVKDNVRVGMATDVGAGTSFNMFQTLNEAYKVVQLQQQKLSALEGFYRATLGGAHSLYLDDKIGNFNIGKEADFVVLDPMATQVQQLRWDNSTTLSEKLFVLMTLGDDRNIYRTYVDGSMVYSSTR
ncbi:guanine deaminase [Endozoicomonas montiporae]|uniref:Guanine deaminase n=2 Tax=Endozoicomonas montiporae TaxID=1027273 RepID=A0A081N4P0_9GAMM|nr:guanine deaminase [Endozoicomonas montiporae]KEQ13413.1 guanine deaminase [Endozoicomonas montiporae]